MFHEIKNPDLDSLVHCFNVPDSSIVFGHVGKDNRNGVYSAERLEELFSEPEDHSAFIFYVDKDKTDDLFNKLTNKKFTKSFSNNMQQGLVAIYHGETKDVVILLETEKGEISREYLTNHNNFGHKSYYFKYFYSTDGSFNGQDNDFLEALEGNQEILEFFRKIDVHYEG